MSWFLRALNSVLGVSSAVDMSTRRDELREISSCQCHKAASKTRSPPSTLLSGEGRV